MIRLYKISTKWLGREQKDWEGLTTSEDVIKLEVIKQERPEINSETQRILRLQPVINLEEKTCTQGWEVIDLSENEIAEIKNARAEGIDQELDIELVKDSLRSQVVELDRNVDKYITLYRYYRVGAAYEVDYVFRYKGELYQVLQAHTSQFDWEPDNLPALYKRVRQAIEAWVQPQGTHDAYQIGDRVTHNGDTWESEIADNVWEPSIHGWKII